jgi:hypothetical protein
LSLIWLSAGREVGRKYRSTILSLLVHWCVTISYASKSWTSIVWKAVAVIRKLEVAKSVNDDQKKGAIPTEGAEPVKRSGPKLVIFE